MATKRDKRRDAAMTRIRKALVKKHGAKSVNERMVVTAYNATIDAQSANKSSKSSKRRKSAPTQDRSANKAFAYSDRVPIIADALKTDHGGSASVAELFETLHTSKDGEFATTRRVAATLRFDARQDTPTFERVGGMVTLRKRNRATSKRKSGNVSRKRTRAAK